MNCRLPLIHTLLFSCLILFLNACTKGHRHVQGYVAGDNIYLASPFYGVLKNLAVTRGQQVKKGDLLFRLDDNPQQYAIDELQNQIKQAQSTLIDLQKPKRPPEIAAIKAQIEQAQSLITLAELRVSRLTKLYAKQATDKDSLDAAVTNLTQQKDLKLQYEANLALAQLGSRSDQIQAQQHQVDALKDQLKQAQWNLLQKTLYAPANGRIFDTYYRRGEFVPGQQAVLSLLTPENIHIEFFIPVDYLAGLKVGQHIQFQCEGCQPNNEAIIRYISPEAEFLPPLVYSRDNDDKLIFRIQATPTQPLLFKPGQPIIVDL